MHPCICYSLVVQINKRYVIDCYIGLFRNNDKENLFRFIEDRIFKNAFNHMLLVAYRVHNEQILIDCMWTYTHTYKHRDKHAHTTISDLHFIFHSKGNITLTTLMS